MEKLVVDLCRDSGDGRGDQYGASSTKKGTLVKAIELVEGASLGTQLLFEPQLQLQAATASGFAPTNWFGTSAACAVLVHQLLQEATEEGLARSWASGFAATSGFDHFVAAAGFSAADWLAARSCMAAEQLLQHPAELRTGAAAWIDNFATTSGFNNLAAASRFATSDRSTTTITETIKQAKASLSGVAGNQEQGQQRRGDHATHR